jgi:hypothetical protein
MPIRNESFAILCTSLAFTLFHNSRIPNHTKVKKGKVVPLLSIEVHLGDRRYSAYSFLTSALQGGEWSASRPGRALPLRKEPPVPII